MKKYLFCFFFLLVLCSCRSVKLQPLRTQTQTTVKDSTATRTEVQDTLLVVKPKEVAKLSALLNKLGQQPIQQTTGGATFTQHRTAYEIQAECECAELKQAVQLYKEIIEFYRHKDTVTKEETTIVETKMPGWAKPFLWLGIGFVVVGLGLATLKIISMKKSFI